MQYDSHERLDGNNLGVFASALPTPEPSTWVMMLAGFGGLALLARRRALVAAGSANRASSGDEPPDPGRLQRCVWVGAA